MIEGVNLETVAVGRTSWVMNYRTSEIVLLRVIRKETQGKDTTVEFTSLIECGPNSNQCSAGGNRYIVTHPYRGGPGEVGREIN